MSKKTNSPTATPAMEPTFSKFLDSAWRKGDNNDTLVLGESHDSTEHLKWLTTHLANLKTRGLRTIGIERDAWVNPLLWAYQNGTLSRELGGKEQAQNYLSASFIAYGNPAFAAHAQAKVDLLIKAMDQGIRVVAYDSRETLKMEEDYLAEDIAAWKKRLASSDSIAGADLAEKQQTIRTNAGQLKAISIGNSKYLWLLSEVDWLLGLKPEYATQYAAIEKLITAGHKEIRAGKLTSDGLSATVFHAMAAPGQRLTIGGAAHMDGLGSYKPVFPVQHPEQIHGIFGIHLTNLCEEGQAPKKPCPHRVTSAVVATIAVGERIANLMNANLNKPNNHPLKDHEATWLNLTTSTTGPFWKPEPGSKPAVTLAEKFPETVFTWGSMRTTFDSWINPQDHTAAHINPQLIPEIKAAMAEVTSKIRGGTPATTAPTAAPITPSPNPKQQGNPSRLNAALH